MSRISKSTTRSVEAVTKLQPIIVSDKIWKTGIYARLSVDSHNQKNESIDTQIQIAKTYISQSADMELVECYTDLGKTGTNFEREGFERMMTDIRQRKINCIVVKDFSRFGRNYIETGNYIEKIFPFMNVRFVAVTDNYDSAQTIEDNDQLSMNLKNIVNELYAKDISERVKKSKKLKQEMGSYTGGVPPYGYLIETDGERKKLIPDEATKHIIKRIFELFVEGNTYKAICTELYERKIYPPTIYYKTKQVFCYENELLHQWSLATLKGILTNPVYIGTLIQSRMCGKDYKTHKMNAVNQEDISIVEHAHEALISEDIFYSAAQRFEKQQKYSNKHDFAKIIPIKEDCFQDIVFCGECGAHMRRDTCVKNLSNGGMVRHYYFSCPNRAQIDHRNCTCKGISEITVSKIVKAVMDKEYKFSEMKAIDYCRINNAAFEKKKDIIRYKQKEALKQKEELSLKSSEWYLQYRMKKITREMFLHMKTQAEQLKETLYKQITSYEEQLRLLDKEAENTNRFLRGLIKRKTGADLDKELMQCLIKRINIYPEHRVEIIFNYRRNEISVLGGKNNESKDI